METISFVAGRDLRRRWRRVVVLAALVGIASAFTLALAAGARRSDTALARFQSSSRAADIEMQVIPVGSQIDAVRHLPGVAALAQLRAMGLIVPAAPDFFSFGAPEDAAFGTTIDRDRIIAGRASRPDAIDEVTVGEGFAAGLGLHVGDRLEIASFTPQQVTAILRGTADPGAPAGPLARPRVVGIVRRPLDLGDQGNSGGLVVLSPAFARAHARDIGVFGARVRIRTDGTDVARVIDDAKRVLGRNLLSSQVLTIDAQGARQAIDVLTLALWIGAAVTALAGAAAIGVMVAREIAFANREQATLRDLGCTRRQRVAFSAPITLLVAFGGAVFAIILAAIASPLFPVGVARRADPSVGVHIDWMVVAIGAVAIATVVAGVGLVTAYRTTATRPARESARSSRVAAAVATFRPTVANGVRMATDAGRGSTAVPVRPAMLGATVGVLGVIAVLVFAGNVEHFTSTPRLYGSTWDVTMPDVTPNTPCGASDDYGLGKDAGLAALTEVCVQNVQVEGRPAGGLAFTTRTGAPIGPPVLEGALPTGAHDVALGTKTMHALGRHVGDTVKISGRARSVDYRISGRVIMPTLELGQPLDDGAVFTGAGYHPLFDQNLFNRYFVGRYAPGADRAAVDARVDARPQIGHPTRPVLPVDVSRLRQTNWLPATLAAFLGLLAVLAVGHALVTSVRRRRRELALLKTLGFNRRQLRATVAWEATTLGLIGVVIGVPVGVFAGVVAWRVLANGLGVASTATIPWLAVGATIAITLLVVNAVAFFPARAAARTRAAVAFRE